MRDRPWRDPRPPAQPATPADEITLDNVRAYIRIQQEAGATPRQAILSARTVLLRLGREDLVRQML